MLVLWLSGSRFYKTPVCWETQGLTAKKEYNCFKHHPAWTFTCWRPESREQSAGLDSRSPPSMDHPSFHHEPPLWNYPRDRELHPSKMRMWEKSGFLQTEETTWRIVVVHALQPKCSCSELSQSTSTSSHPSWWFWNPKWPYLPWNTLSLANRMAAIAQFYVAEKPYWQNLLFLFFKWLGRDSPD